jgi:hypothetical protein
VCAAPNNQWIFKGRDEECIQNLTFTYTTWNSVTKAILATDKFSVNQDIVLSPNSDLFVENDTVSVVATGDPGFAGGEIFFNSACTAPCRLLSTLYNGEELGGWEIVPPETVVVTKTYEMPSALKTQNSTQIAYSIPFQNFAQIKEGLASWGNQTLIRCDNQLAPGTKGPGCVFPSATPTLDLQASIYGAAVVNVAVGEQELVGHPGLLLPLHRGDPNQSQGNMDAICDRTFVPLPTRVPTDSCDEYPFASSLESGGQLLLTGKDCYETIPEIDKSGTWTYWQLTKKTGTQLCERGHVPLALNTGLGSRAIGPFYTANRMMYADAYYVSAST